MNDSQITTTTEEAAVKPTTALSVTPPPLTPLQADKSKESTGKAYIAISQPTSSTQGSAQIIYVTGTKITTDGTINTPVNRPIAPKTQSPNSNQNNYQFNSMNSPRMNNLARPRKNLRTIVIQSQVPIIAPKVTGVTAAPQTKKNQTITYFGNFYNPPSGEVIEKPTLLLPGLTNSITPPTTLKPTIPGLVVSRKLPALNNSKGLGGGMINLQISNGKIRAQGHDIVTVSRDTTATPLIPLGIPISEGTQQPPQQSPTITKPITTMGTIKSHNRPWPPVLHLPETNDLTLTAMIPSISCTSESSTRKTVIEEPVAKISVEKMPNQDLSRCLQEAVDSLFSPNTTPLLKLSNDDDDDVTFTKLPVNSNDAVEEPIKKLPEDKLHIQIVTPTLPIEKTAKSIDTTNHRELKDLDIVPIKPPSRPALLVKAKRRDLKEDVNLIKVPTKSVHVKAKRKDVKEDVEHIKIAPKPMVSVLKDAHKDIKEEGKDIDPMKVLNWNEEGVGVLPGSDLKFRMNEYGMMEMVDDYNDKCDENNKPPGNVKPTPIETDVVIKTEVKEEVKEVKENSISEDIYCCVECGCYGMPSEFINNQSCSEQCSRETAIKEKAKQLHERDLKIMEEKLMKQEEKRAREIMRKEKMQLKKTKMAIELEKKRLEKEEKLKEKIREKELLNARIRAFEEGEDLDLVEQPSSSNVSDAEMSNDASSSPALKRERGFSLTSFMTKNRAAPTKLFRDPFSLTKNNFKIGMKMEGIDPEHATMFCVLSVADVVGYRIKLHFDGYPKKFDFWTDASSKEIFPCGWCDKNERILHPPRGYKYLEFDWTNYIKQCKALATPRSFFNHRYSALAKNIYFRVGMKLEAVDRQNTSLICVATVADLLNSSILVHFDGWDDVYDYWADISSSFIHPVGWCAANNHVLSPPNKFRGEKFSWEEYLKETEATMVPVRAFKPRPSQIDGFSKGMKLECVDRRRPDLIRIATIDDVRDYQIRIKFDGWSDIYSYWIDDDSPDIHPITWCQKSGHYLEPPLDTKDINAECPTINCKGQGHVDGSPHLLAHTVKDCPYDPQALLVMNEEEDRLTNIEDKRNENLATILTDEKSKPAEQNPLVIPLKLRPGRPGPGKWISELQSPPPPLPPLPPPPPPPPEQPRRPGRPPKWRRMDDGSKEASQDADWSIDLDVKREKRRQKKIHKQKAIAKRNLEYDGVRHELHQAVMNPGYEANADACTPFLWAKHSLLLNTIEDRASSSDITSWSVDQVATFVNLVPGCKPMSERFKDSEIDGEALSMMAQQDLITHLGFKLGPAIKLYNSIVLLRQKLDKVPNS